MLTFLNLCYFLIWGIIYKSLILCITLNECMTYIKHYFSVRSYKIRILIGSLFAAVVADGIITKFLIDKGFAREGNPFLADWVVDDKFLYFKIFGGLLVGLYLWNINRRHPRLSIWLTSIFLTGYLFIIIWNLLLLL